MISVGSPLVRSLGLPSQFTLSSSRLSSVGLFIQQSSTRTRNIALLTVRVKMNQVVVLFQLLGAMLQVVLKSFVASRSRREAKQSPRERRKSASRRWACVDGVLARLQLKAWRARSDVMLLCVSAFRPEPQFEFQREASSVVAGRVDVCPFG